MLASFKEDLDDLIIHLDQTGRTGSDAKQVSYTLYRWGAIYAVREEENYQENRNNLFVLPKRSRSASAFLN